MGKSYVAALTAAALVSGVSGPALAGDDKANTPPPPELYQQLMACRAVTDAGERLACYDRQIAAFSEAASKHEIVISDKNAVKAARRGLFGFAAPIGKLMGFGGEDDRAEEIEQIETTVAGVRRSAAGWRLELEDGSTWEQNDTRDFVLSPKIGNAVRISRGALGTYLVSVQGQRAVKMRRIN
ncbi:hypothetical protein SAMN05518801_10891 [Novosphingobium sp. CF614]|uniref:hypothetical protein n=1 Tax=Novosphingobium sp. CF614 TaxID=1884364 RepID=UPI0008E7E711|nr:hypothetical protein [Novosphingobium sp. CF614]SFG14668.1 hypothetical protein SAMN05518801_10891 [Novosphingobium sp. CF614]